MYKFFIPIIIGIVSFSLGNCEFFRRPVSRADAIGTYSANYPGMIDSLVLREDGNYIHYFYDSSGFLYTDSGLWRPPHYGGHKNPNSFTSINLDDFCPRFARRWGSINLDISGCTHYHTSIYNMHGKIRIAMAEGNEIYYEKNQ